MMTTTNRPVLCYRVDDEQFEYFCTNDVVTIGWSPDMDVSVPRISGASRNHTTIRREGFRWIIADNGSRNGTYVDRNRVVTAHLYDGCTIHVGAFPLQFYIPEQLTPFVGLRQSRLGRRRVVIGDPFDLQPNFQPDVSIRMSDFSESRLMSRRELPDDLGMVTDAQTETTSPQLRWFGPQQACSIESFNQLVNGPPIATDVKEMLEYVLDLLFQQVPNADSAAILGFEPQTEVFGSLVERSTDPKVTQIVVSRTVLMKALATRSALLVEDAWAGLDWVLSIRESFVTSLICAPLLHADRIIGAIYLDVRRGQTPLGQRELEIVAALARLAVVAIGPATRAAIGDEFHRVAFCPFLLTGRTESLIPRRVLGCASI